MSAMVVSKSRILRVGIRGVECDMGIGYLCDDHAGRWPEAFKSA